MGTAEGEFWRVSEERLINLYYTEEAISFLKILEVKNVLVFKAGDGELSLSFPRKRRFITKILRLDCIKCKLKDAIKNYEILLLTL